MKLKKSTKKMRFALSIAISLFSVLFAVNSVLAVWQNPMLDPPDNNVNPPISEGSDSQIKWGDLTVSNLYLTTTSEGNIKRLNTLEGYNDLLLYGNSSKSATIYLEGSKVVMNNDTGTGNVGIGTSSPGSLLTVGNNTFQVNSSGNLIKVNNISYSWPSAQGGSSTVLTNDGSGVLTWSESSSGGESGWTDNGATVTLTTATDSVGIGTSSLTDKKVAIEGDGGTGTSLLYINATSSSPSGAAIAVNSTSGSVFQVTGSGTIIGNNLYSGDHLVLGTDALVVKNDGSVGVGTANPGYGKLHLNASALGTNALLAFSVKDGTYNPRVIINHVTATNNQYLQFDSTYSSGTGYADWAFSHGNVGVNTVSPVALLNIYEPDESTSQTSFTQAITNSGILISTDNTNQAFTPGIFWSTVNNNSTKPKAGIYLKEDNSVGTSMYLGTSSSYVTGITNDGIIIDPRGYVDADIFPRTRLNNMTIGTRYKSGSGSYDTTGLYLSDISAGGTSGSYVWVGSLFPGVSGINCSFQPFNNGAIVGLVVTNSVLGTNNGVFYAGVGKLAVSGTGITFSANHVGYKFIKSGGVVTMYATVGNGTSETASSALTTVSLLDSLELFMKINSGTVDFYYRKNGGSLSSLTTINTNVPALSASGEGMIQFAVSNQSTASDYAWWIHSIDYERQ